MPADVSVKGDLAKVFMYLGNRLREIGAHAADCRQETSGIKILCGAQPKDDDSQERPTLPSRSVVAQCPLQ
jgi:hypothetical protein